ncbi:DUF6518 family protein [Saccharopolyspora dendranthemae]|uniref:Uncharacterized protein n=1 Tax=Saccharopolyspora dendranthemae TaxID=1181886 RepID=A0A561U995_9PSEU|nr:DUF6518 family protein [Saccharopolyspora dendranthemae]TWF95931.1 hypothetical protein FHU35_12931 [Saccharopolyspora dendranthemae]
MALAPTVPTGAHRRRGAIRAVLIAAACGLAAGGATAVAQGALPPQVASLANSSGSWTLLAFALALPAPTAFSGAVCGALSLAGMLAGYVLTDLLRGYPSSTGLMVFWGAAAVLAGPVLGLGAQWLRRRPGTRAALGLSALCGVLIGEAGYGLLVLAESTHPLYWWGQAGIGVLLLAAGAAWKLRGPGVIVQVVLFTAAVATAFPVLYLHGSVLVLLVP